MNGDIVEFQASKGGSHFLTHSSFISQATTTYADAGNLLLFNTTDFEVRANLAIDVFTGEFIGDVDTFNLVARRNNILLQTGTKLDVGGNYTNINALDLFTITSLESQVLLSAAYEGAYNAFDNFKIFSDSEVTFSAANGDLIVSVVDSISLFANEGVAIQSTSPATFSIRASNLTATGESIVTETTNGDITHTTATFTSNTFGQETIYAERTLLFSSFENLIFEVDSSIDINADRGFLSLANSPTVPTSALINFSTTFHTVLSGTSVSLTPNDIILNAGDNLRFGTTEEDRDSQINVDTTTTFATSTNLFFVTGGEVEIDSTTLDLISSTDITFTAVGFPSSYITFNTFNQSETATNDISYNGGQFIVTASDNTYFTSNTYFNLNTQDNLVLAAGNDINFNVRSNVTIDTTLDAQYFTSGDIEIGVSILQQLQIDAGYVQATSSGEIDTTATRNITIVGTNINFDVDETLTINTDTFAAAAVRYLVLSGDQQYNYDNVIFTASNTLLQSLPDQDIVLDTKELSVTGNTNFVGRTFSTVAENNINFNVGSTFSIITVEEAPIHIDASNSLSFNSNDLEITTDQDLFFTLTDSLNYYVGSYAYMYARNDLSFDAHDSIDVTSNNNVYFSTEDSAYFYSGGQTTITSASDYYLSINEEEAWVSRWGGITTSASYIQLYGQSLIMEASNANNINAAATWTAFTTYTEILGDLNVQADDAIQYTAFNDLVFFGAEFDIVSFGSLFLSTPQVLTMKSTVITFISEALLRFSSDQTIALTAGLDKDLVFYQGDALGVFTIESGNLRFQSNNILDLTSGTTIDHQADGVDAFGNSILLQSSAMSAGISVDATGFLGTATSNILYVVDDITNRGGDDVNLTGTQVAQFTVNPLLISTAPVNPVPLLADSLEAGIFFYASGSEYDPLLGETVGILYRTEGVKESVSGTGTIHINSFASVYYNSEVYNEILSHDGVVRVESNAANTAYYVGGDLGIESDRSSADYSSGTDTIITVGQTAQIQSSSFTHSLSNEGTYLSAAGDFEAIADRGGVFFNLVGSSDRMRTQAGSINLEGGGNGLYQYTTDTYSATDVSLYSFATAAFLGTDEHVSALHNMYYESSINNDIDITSLTSTSVTATAGDIILNAGLDHSFTAETTSTFRATAGDVTFFSAGSFQYVAEESMNILSVANQNYVGQQRVYFESLGSVNVGDGVTSFPIVTIYAGGDTLRNGVELTAVEDFSFATNVDNNIVGRNWYSTSEFTTDVITGGTMTLQATGTNGIGKDVTFTAGESLDLYSNQNMILTAKTLKFEYDNLDFSTTSDLLLTAVKGILVSGSTFSTDSLTHTLSSKTGLSISANSDVVFDAKTTLSFTSKTTATWKSLSQTEISAGQTMVISSTGTNSPISFTTSNDRSFIEIIAEEEITINSGENIEYSAVNGFLALVNGDTTFTVGDSVTATADGDIIISGRENIDFTASSPDSTGSNFQFTSQGTIHAEVGTDLLVTVGRDLFIEPDVDLTFEGGIIDSNVQNNIFSFVIDNQISITTGNNFNFNVGARTLFSAATYDSVALGVNPENGNGILLSTSGEFSDIEVTAGSGSVLTSAIGNINITSEHAVTLRSAGMVQLLAKGSEGITFSTNELPTPILSVSRNGLNLIGRDDVILQSYGYDTASGYIDLRATGYANLGEVNPIVNGTFGIGFFSQHSDIDIIVDDASFRMADLHHFLATPNVNGSLLLQADGQDVDGVGIRIESTIVRVMAELDVAFEANNIHFFDYGISQYNYDIGTVFPTYADVNRPTIQSSKDQTFVAYGHNDKGNAIELLSSIPNSPILFRTGYINYYSGGSLLIEGEINTYIYSEVETDIISATSVVLQGDGLNADYGIYLTTRDQRANFVYDGENLGSNIEFNSKIDSYILTAERLIDEATQNIYFVTGPDGTINLTFDEGALFESSNGVLNVNTNNLSYYSNGKITLEANDLLQSNSNSLYMSAEGLSDGSGNIVWGDPEVQEDGGVTNIALSAQGNINFFTNYLDIANTNQLEIPRYINGAPGCSGANEGSLFFVSIFPYEYLCSCVVEVVGWNNLVSTVVYGENICYPFRDILSY